MTRQGTRDPRKLSKNSQRAIPGKPPTRFDAGNGVFWRDRTFTPLARNDLNWSIATGSSWDRPCKRRQTNGADFGLARKVAVHAQVWIAAIIAGTPRMATSLLKL